MTDNPNADGDVTPAVTDVTDLSQYTDLSQITDMDARKQYLEQVLHRYPIWLNPNAYNQGRPTKCTEQLVHDICTLLADGAYIQTACAAVGVGNDKVSAWTKRAAADEAKGMTAGFGKGQSPFIFFRDSSQIAFSQAEARLLAEIHAGRDDRNWPRIAWILERTRQVRYGQRQEIRHTHELVAPTLPPRTATTYTEWIEHRLVDNKQLEGAVDAEYQEI